MKKNKFYTGLSFVINSLRNWFNSLNYVVQVYLKIYIAFLLICSTDCKFNELSVMSVALLSPLLYGYMWYAFFYTITKAINHGLKDDK